MLVLRPSSHCSIYDMSHSTTPRPSAAAFHVHCRGHPIHIIRIVTECVKEPLVLSHTNRNGMYIYTCIQYYDICIIRTKHIFILTVRRRRGKLDRDNCRMKETRRFLASYPLGLTHTQTHVYHTPTYTHICRAHNNTILLSLLSEYICRTEIKL